MGPITISLILAGVALMLLVLELFLPSAGVLLVLSILSAAGSVLFAFRYDYQFGIWLLIGELSCVPIFAWLFIRIWPSTPIGRRMIIHPPEAKAFTWETRSLVGKTGTTRCDLVPTGEIDVDGRAFPATSQVGLIAKGTRVRVAAEEMGQLYVQPAIDDPEPQSAMGRRSPSASALDRPANDLGIDSLE